jgi:[ribosomal protein S5]-alanine N-acetyltransferase
MTFETENLILRRYEQNEKEFLSRLLKDESVMKYVGDCRPLTESENDYLWNRIHKVNYAENKIGVWVIFSKSDSRYIGHAAIKPRPENDSEWEIVYYLLKEEWGKGYGKETALKLVEIGFDIFELKTVYATVDEENAPSIKILEKIGMNLLRYEFDEQGRFSVYSINREDYL